MTLLEIVSPGARRFLEWHRKALIAMKLRSQSNKVSKPL